ncbi:MAG: GIY-YIG nuclease family protein [Candidatus Thorarchaeota archaeon]|jgi:Uri superfamily endonuclease
MKGVYVLIIQVKQPVKVQIKSLRETEFEPGAWVYVGSAMGTGSTNLKNRISRHFRKEKTIHWHIDYLFGEDTEIEKAIWAQSERHLECDLAQSLASKTEFKAGPKGFGASDCKSGCVAHIFRYQGGKAIDDVLTEIFDGLGLQPRLTMDGIL